ncbi:hypothetical protein NSQ26_06855 [Bacillus sp. FSL W7-1360]
MRKHFIVLILPVILMLIIAVSGLYYLKQEKVFSNELLQREIEITAEVRGDELTLSWRWPQMPSDGMYGTDYIGIAFDKAAEVSVGEVILPLEEEQVFRGTRIENGVVFSYPTEMIEHESVGARGQLRQVLPANVDLDEVHVTMLHTWTNHEDLRIKDALFEEPRFGEAKAVQHWVKTMTLSELIAEKKS